MCFEAAGYCVWRPGLWCGEAGGGLVGGHRPFGLVVERGLSVALSHVVFAGIDPDRVVHDAVEDRVGDCFASMFVRQVRQCFSAVWADGFPRCRHRFPVM